MRTALSLALIGALAAGSALARGMEGQSSEIRDQPYQQQGMQQDRMRSGQQAMDRDTVRQVQQKLQDQGYKVGQIDGQMGPNTKQALRQFQKDQGLQGAGQINQQTMAALGVEAGGMQQAQTPEQQHRLRMQQQQPSQGDGGSMGGGMMGPGEPQNQPGGYGR